MLYLQYLFELLQLYIVLKPDLKNTVIKLINKEMKKITWHCALGQRTLDRLQVATNLSQYCSFFSNITNRKFLTPQVSSIGCSDLLGSLEHCSVLIINLFLNLQSPHLIIQQRLVMFNMVEEIQKTHLLTGFMVTEPREMYRKMQLVRIQMVPAPKRSVNL